MPHLHCYVGNPYLIWGMFTTDLLIGLAYFGISILIWGLVKKTQIKFSSVVVYFSIFIGACGLTHFMEVWTLWRPDYWVSLFVKFVTATASIGTFIYLFRLRHSIVQVAEITKDLELRVEERTKEAKESEAKFKSLANSISQLAWMTRADGYITWYNDRWYEYTGANLEQMQGWGWQHVHHPDFTAKVTEKWLKHLKTGEDWEDTFPLKGKDGQYRWFLSRARATRDEKGQIIHWFGTNTDITEERAADERLRLVTNAVPALIAYLTHEHKYLFVNKAYERFFNRPASDFVNRTLKEIVGPETYNNAVTQLNKALQGESVEFEYEANYPGIGRHFMRANYIPDFEGTRVRGVVSLVTDLTQDFIASEKLRAAVNELEKARREAERANELKTTFLANMSHEIRTPLGAMIGFADLLRDPELAESEKESYLDVITRNGENLAIIINDILDLSKVEAGHLTLEYSDVFSAKIAEEVVELLALKAREKDLKLEFSSDESTPDRIVADPLRVRQILVNLVGNAIKFTQFGGIKIRSYGCKTKNGRNAVCYEIADTGIGIPESQKEKVFETFVQADGSMTRRFGGTGLGLALSKRLANEMGGDVSILATQEDVGTTFQVVIEDKPQKRSVNAGHEKRIPSGHVLGVEALKGLHILVVDDAADNQALIRLFLTKHGATVESAENGLLGYKTALNGNFDIVLMDIQMPVMDGYTATQKLREYGYRKPIIAITAHAMSEVRRKALNIGYTDHLTKPINATELIDTIVRYTAKNSSTQSSSE